jgi:two-component system KDP operon response regulator KdpE
MNPPPAPPAVLIIEDEPSLRRFLSVTLRTHDYRVEEAETARQGLELLTGRPPELILLDLGLPDGDGVDLVRKVREWSQVPIIVLSARDRESDKIRALDAGADDYLTKPFAVGELLARLRVALRHGARAAGGAGEPVFTSGELRVDLARRQVFRGDEEVHLTPIEYRILTVLLQNAGKVTTHKHLLTTVWGPKHAGEVHYLRVYMAQLRQKLEADPNRPRLLLTEAGVGYRLKAE